MAPCKLKFRGRIIRRARRQIHSAGGHPPASVAIEVDIASAGGTRTSQYAHHVRQQILRPSNRNRTLVQGAQESGCKRQLIALSWYRPRLQSTITEQCRQIVTAVPSPHTLD